MNASSLHKVGKWFYDKKIPVIPNIINKVIFFLYNSYIPSSASIGEGTLFAYGAIGVVLHAKCGVGERCVIGQGVTIGAAEGYFSTIEHAAPLIGNNCYIAAGAKILGAITIGDSCIIGAGSVVLSSIPPHSVVVGAPAKIVKTTTEDYLAIRN